MEDKVSLHKHGEYTVHLLIRMILKQNIKVESIHQDLPCLIKKEYNGSGRRKLCHGRVTTEEYLSYTKTLGCLTM